MKLQKVFSKKLIIFTVSLIIVAGIFSMSGSHTPVVTFTLAPLSVGDTKIPDIKCWAKAKTLVTNESGAILREANSPFLIDNPTFSFTASTDDKDADNGSYKHQVRIRCQFPGGDFEKTKYPLIVEQGSKFQVKAYTYEQGVDEKVLAYHETKTTESETELFFDKEEVLIEFSIPINDIVASSKNGNYEAQQEIRTQGIITMHYNIAPGVPYGFNIEDPDIPVYFPIDIDKSGDSGPDEPEETPGTFPKPPVKNTDRNEDSTIIGEMMKCWSIFDYDCAFQDKFIPIYVGGFIALIIIGIIFEMVRGRNR